MPRVHVEVGSRVITLNRATLRSLLKEAVATNVSSSEAQFDAKEVSVKYFDEGPYDSQEHDVQVTIWAGLYPSRLMNKDERAKAVLERIRPLINHNNTVDVCLILADMGYDHSK